MEKRMWLRRKVFMTGFAFLFALENVFVSDYLQVRYLATPIVRDNFLLSSCSLPKVGEIKENPNALLFVSCGGFLE